MDFACSSGLRADTLRKAAEDPAGVIEDYESFKISYVAPGETESTNALCRRQGLSFVPMVMEAHSGGWSKTARRVLDTIARHTATTHRRSPEEASLDFAQRLSCSLHRENARAVLRRLAVRDGEAGTTAWDPGHLDDFGDDGEVDQEL